MAQGGQPISLTPGCATPSVRAKEAGDVARESPSLASNPFDIRDRIDAALEKMRAQDMEVRAIYLTEKDRKALGKAIKAEWGFKGKVHPCAYRDHFVREGKHSVIYSTHGVQICIPKLLSHRVAERKAA